MDALKSFTNKLPNPFVGLSKSQIILWIIIPLVLFIAAAIFIYVNYIEPQLMQMDYNANYEFDKTVENSISTIGVDTRKKVNLYLFWACWCPNSNQEGATGKKLHDLWDKVEDDYKNKKWNVKKYKLNFKKINENDNDFGYYESIVKKNGEIEGFPSIFLVYDDFVPEKDTSSGSTHRIVYEFDASPTEENIKEFVKTALNIG